jgi:hypothetical protein
VYDGVCVPCSFDRGTFQEFQVSTYVIGDCFKLTNDHDDCWLEQRLVIAANSALPPMLVECHLLRNAITHMALVTLYQG